MKAKRISLNRCPDGFSSLYHYDAFLAKARIFCAISGDVVVNAVSIDVDRFTYLL